MDGCLICGAQHIGSCNPRHPEHRPLSAEQWAEREARSRDSEKETIMPNTAEHDSTPSRWQTLKEQMRPWFSRGAEAAPKQSATQKAEREQSEPSRRYDLETPGPTEAAGGSFQQFHSKSEAEREASRLSPSQDYRLDRAHHAHGPTDSYVLTTLPAPGAVARDARVDERIRQIEDPEQRARAAALLETIRSEVNASQQQQRERDRAQERGRELER